MKVMIISDTHGSTYGLYKAVEAERPFDVLLHMGDVCGNFSKIETMAGSPQTACAAVAGNCDLFTELPSSRDMVLLGHRIHMEHGFWSPFRDEEAVAKAHEAGTEIVMTGHTHRPRIDKRDGVWLINPGSLSSPRQSDGKRTYIIMELEAGEDPKFELKSID